MSIRISERAARAMGLAPEGQGAGATTPLIVSVAGHPPTVNHMYLTTRDGARILTPRARAWYDLAIPTIQDGARGWACPAGPLRLELVLYALPRTRDIDNATKAAIDAIARAVGFDDRRIDMLTVIRGAGRPARTAYTLGALL